MELRGVNLKPNLGQSRTEQSPDSAFGGGFMIDYLATHSLATFLVCADYLGAINHTMLSLNALTSRGIRVLGVIVSGEDRVLGEFLSRRGERVFSLPRFGVDGDFKAAAAWLGRQIRQVGVLDA